MTNEVFGIKLAETERDGIYVIIFNGPKFSSIL